MNDVLETLPETVTIDDPITGPVPVAQGAAGKFGKTEKRSGRRSKSGANSAIYPVSPAIEQVMAEDFQRDFYLATEEEQMARINRLLETTLRQIYEV